MADTLSKLAKPQGATREKTRIGRGVGSGLGKTAGRGQKGQFARRKFADAVAMHRQLDRLGRRSNVPAFTLQLGQGFRVDRLDLRDDHVGLVGFHCGPKSLAVEHRENLERIGDLHGRSIFIAVAGNDPAAEPFRGDRELAAKLARSQKHQCGGVHLRAIAAPAFVG